MSQVLEGIAKLAPNGLVDFVNKLGPKELTTLEFEARAARAAVSFNTDGFQDFYWVLWGREMPPYAREWVNAFIGDEWTILECFRGSTKSTTLSVTYSLFCLGHQPHTSVLIVQANDPAASDTTALMASIIEHYEGWKKVFPHVVPDKEKGWGAQGYFIKDIDFIEHNGYGAWLEICGKDHLRDPSFVGLGIASGSIVGMHPHRLLFDDIHDSNNSAYAGERRKIVETMRANILPTITKAGEKPFVGVSCTFWDDDDAYHALLDTGLFKHIKTPIMTFDDKGEDEFEGKNVSLTWKDGFPIDLIKVLRKGQSKAEFARMYLCDLEEAKARLYKWYQFPHEKISLEEPMSGGVDYASTWMPTSGQEGGRSHFAMAYVAKLSYGGAVVVDGVVEQCSQAEAETHVMAAQNLYPGWLHSVIESDGVGAQFIQLLQRNPQFRVIPKKTSDIFRGAKERRQYELLSPLLERGVLRISDADTKFLNIFRNYLENYPNLERHAPEWDVADSVLWAVVGMPDIQQQAQTIMPDAKKSKRTNIYSALGRH